MKKVIFAVVAVLFVAISTKALEPVRIGLNYPNPSGSLTVQLVNVATNSVVTSQTISGVEANNSGVVSLVVGENDPDWGNLPASLTSNSSIMVRVLDGGVFIKQFVFRDLVATQASTGNGDILDDGFNSTGGLTTSGATADDFLFGAQAIPFGGFGGFIEGTEETKFFFKNNIGAIRAGAVDGTVWDVESLGQYSAAFGFNTEASGESSFAAGNTTEAFGDYSTALGFYSTASGIGSFAAGSDADAGANYSSAFGIGTSAQSYAEFAVGSYNTEDAGEGASRLFVVGNGYDGDGIFRSDAFEVFNNGNARVHTDLEVDNDAYINGTLEVDGLRYPAYDGSDGQILSLNTETDELEWTDAPTFELFVGESLTGDGTEETPLSVNFFTDGTLNGDPFSEEGSLGVDLTASNTWSGNTEFSGDLSLTEASFTGNGNQALYTDDNGLVTAGSGETVQNAAGIFAGTYSWDSGQTTNTVSDPAIDANSIISLTFEGAGSGQGAFAFRIVNLGTGSFDIEMDGTGPTTGTIHYMIINQ